MKNILTILLLLNSCYSIAGSNSVFGKKIECYPEKRVYVNPDNVKEEKVEGKKISQNKTIITWDGNNYNVETRDNRPVKLSISGNYEIFYSEAIMIKIEVDTKKYFEFVNLGLGSITYYGKCN